MRTSLKLVHALLLVAIGVGTRSCGAVDVTCYSAENCVAPVKSYTHIVSSVCYPFVACPSIGFSGVQGFSQGAVYVGGGCTAFVRERPARAGNICINRRASEDYTGAMLV